jgi:prevent-host-death family protein
MDKIIGVTELQRKFHSVFDEVAKRRIPYILTRGSRPEAVIISYEQYLKFVQADESGVMNRINRALARMAELNAGYSDEEIEADLVQATKTVRGRKKKS